MATSVRYTGPPGLHNIEVGQATGGGDELVPGKDYEVDADLADRLVDGSPFWKRTPAKKGGKE